MASLDDHKQQQYLPNVFGGGATAAPPPTPSTQTNHLSTAAAADDLSKLLHRLPPNLSLPTRRASPSLHSPPTISFSENSNPSLLENLLSTNLGFFQLTDHLIPPELARAAESESLSLFDLPIEKKKSLFHKIWPFGFNGDCDELEHNGTGESFCLGTTTTEAAAETAEKSLSSLREFVYAMKKLGFKIIEFLSGAVGFENPVRDHPNRFRSMVWISEGSRSTEPEMAGGFYPYIVGLHYQTDNKKYSLLGDSGWCSTAPLVDSVLVSVGDIAQVWSNGKLKKVRGRPVPMVCSTDAPGNSRHRILISVLITLPIDSEVSSFIPAMVKDCNTTVTDQAENIITKEGEEEEEVENFPFFLFRGVRMESLS